VSPSRLGLPRLGSGQRDCGLTFGNIRVSLQSMNRIPFKALRHGCRQGAEGAGLCRVMSVYAGWKCSESFILNTYRKQGVVGSNPITSTIRRSEHARSVGAQRRIVSSIASAKEDRTVSRAMDGRPLFRLVGGKEIPITKVPIPRHLTGSELPGVASPP